MIMVKNLTLARKFISEHCLRERRVSPQIACQTLELDGNKILSCKLLEVAIPFLIQSYIVKVHVLNITDVYFTHALFNHLISFRPNDSLWVVGILCCNNDIGGEKSDINLFRRFCQFIREACPSLRFLSLTNNQLRTEHLFELYTIFQGCRNLERVNLSFNQFSEHEMYTIQSSFGHVQIIF